MSANAEERPKEAPGRLLVVDDQEAVRRAHARMLRRENHEVVEASSVAEALQLLEESRFDAVLSDVHMPEANGIELLQAVRNRDDDVSVVLISGNPDVPTALKAVEYGALEYLTKPVELQRLMTSMARAVGASRAKRDARLDAQRLRSGERLRSFAPSEPGSWTGQVLGGRYRLGRKIGEGGMGAVYEAVRQDLAGVQVAVKVVHPNLGASPELLQRFRRESELLASIDHPNVVRVLDFEAPDGAPAILVMELLHGAPLASALVARGTFSQGRAISIVQQLLSGLAAIHGKHIIHRDIKPDNVFLTPLEGLGDAVRLLDFGIAKAIDVEDSLRLTRTGAIVGTPAYMPPEQARGEAFDHYGDIYAVGCILYEMLAGARPYDGDNYNALLRTILEGRPVPLDEVRPDVAPEVCRIVEKAMHISRQDRYPSAAAMSADLGKWSTAGNLSMLPPGRDDSSRAPTMLVSDAEK